MANFFSSLPKSEEASVAFRPTRSQPRTEVEAAARAHEEQLLGIEGVEGVGVSRDRVVLYVRDASVAERVPERIGGFEVEVVVTGEIAAY